MNTDLELLSELKKVVFRLDSDIIKNMKRIAIEKDTTQNDLFVEGCKYIVNKYKEFLK